MTDHAATLRSLHIPGTPLVLANAWDAASARVAVAAGAPAVATTSAGVSWCLGSRDGDALPRAEALAHLSRIVAAVTVPVTADIESGFGATPAEVAETIRAVVALGVAGINIEDAARGAGAPLRAVEDQCARLSAVREAAGDALFVNARIDTYLTGTGGVAETVERARAYVTAGADGVFVPGVGDPAAIAELVAAIDAPLNVMVGPGAPTVAELAKLGVARVSLGSSVAEAAYAVARRVVTELHESGTYAALDGKYDFGTLNALMG